MRSSFDSPGAKPLIVDSHHHFVPAELFSDLERYLAPGVTVQRKETRILFGDSTGTASMSTDVFSDLDRQIADMDDAGVRTSILSASTLQSWLNIDGARIYNSAVAHAQRQYPGRFIGLAHVPPFGEAESLDELRRAIVDLELKGVCITTSFGGRYPDDPLYEPFYETVDALDVPIFVHATICQIDAPHLADYKLGESLGRAVDHALVTARILYSGVLERHRNIRFLMGHLGGCFYGMVERLTVDLPSRSVEIPVRDYAAQLRRIWFDTAPSAWNGPAEIEHAVKTLGADRICFGTDYPLGDPSTAMLRSIAAVSEAVLSAGDRNDVFAENAIRLFCLREEPSACFQTNEAARDSAAESLRRARPKV